MDISIRKSGILVEKLNRDSGPAVNEPVLRGLHYIVVENPYAGQYQEDLLPFLEALKPIAVRMAAELMETLGVTPSQVESYGKGAIVGTNGDLEQAVLWHSAGGYGVRTALEGGKALVPGTQKMGAVGDTLDLPLGNVDWEYVRSHFDTIGLTVTDAPRPNEIVYAVAYGLGGRVGQRLGGDTAADGRAKSGRA